MKKQFWFEDVERELLSEALALWSDRLGIESAGEAHKSAKKFTMLQIKKMQQKIAPEPAKSSLTTQ